MSTDLTHDDVQSILKMIDAAEHLEEIEIVHGNFRLHVIRNGGAQRAGPPASAPANRTASSTTPIAPRAERAAVAPSNAKSDTPKATVPEGLIAVRAPMLGLFYRASAPDEKPFVEVGQRVRADDTVCLIEVMKLFNSIRAGVDGEIVKIPAENGAMVEFDEPLIYINPSKG